MSENMKRIVRKIRVLTKLGWSILGARLTNKRRPIFMGLYITNRCNLRCKYCFVNIDNRFDDPARAGFSKEEVFKIVDELYALGTRWIFLLGGEPCAHKDVGAIVKHITDKGILLHILTNGTMIESKIEAIKSADAVCVSIDGDEAATDAMRGKGTFRRALQGVRVALAHNMKARIHAVLDKHSIGDMEKLAEMAREMGVTITISPPNYLGACDDPALQLTKEEYQDFLRRYRRLKEQGYPIGNSFYSIDKALHWPLTYHEFIKNGQHFDSYEPIPCVIGKWHGCIDAEGTMFNCIQLGCMDGVNIKDVGVEAAWNALPSRRPDCVSCASLNTIEIAAYLMLRPEIIMDGFRFFFGRKKGPHPQSALGTPTPPPT